MGPLRRGPSIRSMTQPFALPCAGECEVATTADLVDPCLPVFNGKGGFQWKNAINRGNPNRRQTFLTEGVAATFFYPQNSTPHEPNFIFKNVGTESFSSNDMIDDQPHEFALAKTVLYAKNSPTSLLPRSAVLDRCLTLPHLFHNCLVFFSLTLPSLLLLQSQTLFLAGRNYPSSLQHGRHVFVSMAAIMLQRFPSLFTHTSR